MLEKLPADQLQRIHLDNKIPVLTDNIGGAVLFETQKFELIESDINIIHAHKVAIHYITGNLTLLNTPGDYLILTQDAVKEEEEIQTFTIKLQDHLSVVNYKTAATQPYMFNN